MTGQSTCLNCGWPFNVPGSSVHKGTFVSVFDASTGKMLYHELEPDYVTQLAITDGRLIIGDENGNPQNPGSMGVWGSVSAVRALTVTGTGTATQDWAYSTGAPVGAPARPVGHQRRGWRWRGATRRPDSARPGRPTGTC